MDNDLLNSSAQSIFDELKNNYGDFGEYVCLHRPGFNPTAEYFFAMATNIQCIKRTLELVESNPDSDGVYVAGAIVYETTAEGYDSNRWKFVPNTTPDQKISVCDISFRGQRVKNDEFVDYEFFHLDKTLFVRVTREGDVSLIDEEENEVDDEIFKRMASNFLLRLFLIDAIKH